MRHLSAGQRQEHVPDQGRDQPSGIVHDLVLEQVVVPGCPGPGADLLQGRNEKQPEKSRGQIGHEENAEDDDNPGTPFGMIFGQPAFAEQPGDFKIQVFHVSLCFANRGRRRDPPAKLRSETRICNSLFRNLSHPAAGRTISPPAAFTLPAAGRPLSPPAAFTLLVAGRPLSPPAAFTLLVAGRPLSPPASVVCRFPPTGRMPRRS